MTRRSPVVAMLWEQWRLTRVEAAWRLGLGMVAASAALVLFDAGATPAFWILLWLNAIVWLSISKLNGGRFLDGYKPGFPLHLLYTRPVPTAVFVGVAMAYDAVAGAALYVVSAALVGFVFGQPLPLFSVTVWLLTFHLVYTSLQWSTQNRVVQWLGSIVVCLPLFLLLRARAVSPLHVKFSLAENALMASIGLVAFGLAVAGVARQRRGDVVTTAPRAAGSGGYPDWLVNLFRFPCPTSSATRAQVWFELKSSGLPVLAIGLGLAMLIFLLFAIGISVTPVRHAAVSVTLVFAPVGLLILAGNAFGIRRKQGRTYASAFAATQPYGTAQLAGLKVLVRSGCVLVALIAVGVSVWTSSSLVSGWGTWMIEGKDAVPGLLRMRHKIGDAFRGLTGYAPVARAVVASIAVVVVVASQAVFSALRTRYSRRVNIAGSLLLLYGFALVLLARAAQRGMGSELLLHAMLRAAGWIAAATVLGTAYIAWRARAERLLTLRYVCGALVISGAFGTAWVTVLRAAGVQLGGMSTTRAVWMLSPVLLPLMVSMLAPWSLNRIRHI